MNVQIPKEVFGSYKENVQLGGVHKEKKNHEIYNCYQYRMLLKNFQVQTIHPKTNYNCVYKIRQNNKIS